MTIDATAWFATVGAIVVFAGTLVATTFIARIAFQVWWMGLGRFRRGSRNLIAAARAINVLNRGGEWTAHEWYDALKDVKPARMSVRRRAEDDRA